MHDTLPLLRAYDFPPRTRGELTSLQANLGYLCNQQCVHCHVAASPKRTEIMTTETINELVALVRRAGIRQVDLTGGAPELNPQFRALVSALRDDQVQVIDRCNLTILLEPGQEDLAQFLADQQVHVIASLPCYSAENVDQQRGKGVYATSIAGLKMLNDLGYGKAESGLKIDLVYNPLTAVLPPPQAQLQQTYKLELAQRHGIVFNNLLTLTNMPINRFGSTLVSHGNFDSYLQTLQDAYQPENLDSVMCRHQLSIDWQGYIYDCDFNQMLGIPQGESSDPVGDTDKTQPRPHIRDLQIDLLAGASIATSGHCFGCTAGQGSSCGGALTA